LALTDIPRLTQLNYHEPETEVCLDKKLLKSKFPGSARESIRCWISTGFLTLWMDRPWRRRASSYRSRQRSPRKPYVAVIGIPF